MYKNLLARLGRREDEGFTLIELMVVVLIIAILMAIAIPTFLSARGNAQAKGAESNVHNVITDEQTYFTGAGGGSAYGTAAQMNGSGPATSVDASINFIGTFATGNSGATELGPGNNTVYVAPSTAAGTTAVLIGAEGGNGKFYWAYDNNGQVTYDVTGSGTTSAPAASSVTATTWAQAEQAAAA